MDSKRISVDCHYPDRLIHVKRQEALAHAYGINAISISRDEAKEIIEKGKVGPFDDLLSKRTGKPFAATLYLKANFQVGYRFAKR